MGNLRPRGWTAASALLSRLSHVYKLHRERALFEKNKSTLQFSPGPSQWGCGEYINYPYSDKELLGERKMRVFVVLTLAVVVPGLALGRLLSKCELKRELEEANLELSDGAKRKLSDEDFVAKIVCHVEKSTGFNTSTVIRMNPDGELGPPRRERRSTAGGHLGAGHLHTKMPPRTRPPDFIDDDITDDIECLETLKMRLENGLHGPHKIAFMRMAKLLFQRECYQVVSSDYFSDC